MSIRSTLLACITALACIAILIAYVHKNTRYEMVSGQEGVYVLDRQTTLMHHCDKKKCKLLSPEGSSVEAMRALSGAPSVNLVRKKQPATCVVPEKKVEKNYNNVNISSFQSIAQPMPSMNELKGNSADALGMAQVNQQVQKPQNPFPRQNRGAPAPQPKARVAAQPEPQAESSGYGDDDSSGGSATPEYGDSETVESTPAVEAIENRYGAVASGGETSGSDPYASTGGSGETGESDPYASAGGSSDSSDGPDPYASAAGSSDSSGGSDPYASAGGSGDSSDGSDSYPS